VSQFVWHTRLITAVLLVLSLASPAAAQEPGPATPGCPAMAGLRRSLDSLEAHNPVDDARAAVSRGDYHERSMESGGARVCRHL
jgi:hypothetical protein